MIHAYKYNGWLYRSVEYPYVLYENEDILCLYLPKNKVRLIKAKELTKQQLLKKYFFSSNSSDMVWYFFKKKWFNVIGILKAEGTSFYINIASPYFVEENAIKYVDFDLDIKINFNNEFKVIDTNEYKLNSQKWRYPESVVKKIEESRDEIIQLIKDGFFKKLFTSEELASLQKYVSMIFQQYRHSNKSIEKLARH